VQTPRPPRILVYDVGALTHLDKAALDALARLQLEARRVGATIELQNACAELVSLLALAGLSEVLPVAGASCRPMDGQPEHREQLGVDEEVDRGDPVA
jgi:hypothetical protein